MVIEEIFEEMYSEALDKNIHYKKLVHKANKLGNSLTKYPEFKQVYETDTMKELLVYKELFEYLMNTIEVFIAAHKIKTKQDKKLVFRGLKKQFRKLEEKIRKTNEKYLLESNKLSCYSKVGTPKSKQ